MPAGVPIVGIEVAGADAAAVLDGILEAERLGIRAAWVTTGPLGADGLTVLAAAAARTEKIMLGSAVTPIYPRHPIVTVQQALAIASLAPGRLRLGIGPGNTAALERVYGIPQHRPLSRLRTALRVTRSLLQEGSIDLDEGGIVAHGALTETPLQVPVMISALRAASFELAGELADGAITWVCPVLYVVEQCLPALKRGAERAGREAPPAILHVPICVTEDVAAAREAVREAFAFNARSAFYQAMWDAAGFPEARQTGEWSDAMLDAVAIVGTEAPVADRIRELGALGIGEILASPLGAGSDPAHSRERTLRLLARL
jgi:alkanesulfonate monooxygenase SsuD/methylene tetrahydromethanopterin reductase-like flavin-dependent oxidoreductase (luciferase family)